MARRIGEFELIARYFAPLAKGFKGARALKSDNAFLAADQRRFGILMSGGDTTSSPGPTTVTITAFGKVARGKGLGRDGARPGDELWVSGTIGDAALGLLVARRRLKGASLEKR